MASARHRKAPRRPIDSKGEAIAELMLDVAQFVMETLLGDADPTARNQEFTMLATPPIGGCDAGRT
jgi:hypothetical protein